MLISRTRLHPQAESELVWFFTEFEGECGLKSSHGTLLNMALSGSTSPEPSNVAENRAIRSLSSARRASRIASELRLLKRADYKVLWLAYGAPAIEPKNHLRLSSCYLGRLTWVASLSETLRSLAKGASWKRTLESIVVKSIKNDAEAKKNLGQIKHDAESIFYGVCSKFDQNRQGSGGVNWSQTDGN